MGLFMLRRGHALAGGRSCLSRTWRRNFALAAELAFAHNAIMAGSKRKTKFEPVQLKAEPDWYVRITLPHGEEIHIDEFKTEAEARVWIDDKSSAWLKKYRGGRYA